MRASDVVTLAFFALEFVLVSAMLLGAYRLRHRVGLGGVVAVVASMQFLQAALAATAYWPLWPGLWVSPGSSILFASNLAILLVAFERDGVRAARDLLYAIMIANVVVFALGAVIAWHMTLEPPRNELGVPPELFAGSALASILGVVLLYVDQVLVVLGHAWLCRRAPHMPLFVRMAGLLVVVLALDALVYVGVLFRDSPELVEMLWSAAVSKILAGLAFGITWGLFLQRWDRRRSQTVQRVVDALLFRSDMDALRDAVIRDELTNLYNRRFYDMVLASLFEGDEPTRPQRFGLLVGDLDGFKKVNDTYGHAVGDDALQAVGVELLAAVRQDDLVFRYGGDEFAVLLLDTDRDGLQRAAHRLRAIAVQVGPMQWRLSLAVGSALYPQDGTDPAQLFQSADERMYRAKHRNAAR